MVMLDRALRTAVAAVSVLGLAGCTATVAGVAQKATGRTDADGVVVALLDTGNYATAAGHPMGPAGSTGGGALLEAHRMAVNVVGPWQVDATYRQRGSLLNTTTTSPLNEAKLLSQNNVLTDPMPDVAAAHGYITGFSSLRMAGPTKLLVNVVLRFPDVDSAGAAAREMADRYPYIDVRPRPATIDRHPEAIATLYDAPGGAIASASFTAHGPYVLFQAAQIDSFTGHGPYVLYQGAQSKQAAEPDQSPEAAWLVESALGRQGSLIDQFSATDPVKLADLPLDPTGKLLARTLPTSDGDATFVVGVWPPHGWLHFEDDPVAATARYAAAGVEVVAKGLTTVYQTNNADGAAGLVERLATQWGPSVKTTTGVPGLSAAKCFSRPEVSVEPTIHEMAAHFRCTASADRYTFIAYSDTEKDVKQQIAAQYRILAGK